MNETWTGEIYSAQAFAGGDFRDSRDTELPSDNKDPQTVLAAFKKTFLI